MARYRKIDVRMYGDAKFRRLSRPQPCGQYLWIWLLTGPCTSVIPGVIPHGPAAMAERIGWPVEAFRKAFAEVLDEGMAKADFDAPLIVLPNAVRYDPPQSPNVVRSWRVVWDELPECSLKLEFWQSVKGFLEAFGKGFTEAFGEACPKPSANPEPEPEPEPEKEDAIASLSTTPSSTAPPPCPHQKILDLYELILPELPGVRRNMWQDSPSARELQARWREDPKRQSLEYWERLFTRIREMPLLMGRAPPKPDTGLVWRADLRWIVKRTNFTKIIEGRYHRPDKEQRHGLGAPAQH